MRSPNTPDGRGVGRFFMCAGGGSGKSCSPPHPHQQRAFALALGDDDGCGIVIVESENIHVCIRKNEQAKNALSFEKTCKDSTFFHERALGGGVGQWK